MDQYNGKDSNGVSNLVKIIEDTVNIEDVISKYIDVKKLGRNYRAICPFHNDVNPSMSISPEKKIYKCFSCGAGGNLINFVMNYENTNFISSIKKISEMSNISWNIYINEKVNVDKKRERLNNLNLDLLKLFQYNFENSIKVEEKLIKFVAGRKLTDDKLKEFKIGFADDKVSYIKFLEGKGYTVSEMIEAGVVKKIERDDKNIYLDYFTNRIIFPIFDKNEYLVGFSGRDLDQNNIPKYLNTPSTYLFKKNNILFNLFRAKKDLFKSKSIIIVEGYMDVISLYGEKINNSVATMGTFLSKENISEIKKNTTNITLIFDSDDAGTEAFVKNGLNLLRENLSINCISLGKEYKDIDEMISRDNDFDFNNLLKRDFIDFYLDLIGKQDQFNKKKLINNLLFNINLIEDILVRELFFQRISDFLKIDKKLLLKKSKSVSKKTDKYLEDHIPEIAENINIYKEENISKINIEEKEDDFHLNMEKKLINKINQNEKLLLSYLTINFETFNYFLKNGDYFFEVKENKEIFDELEKFIKNDKKSENFNNFALNGVNSEDVNFEEKIRELLNVNHIDIKYNIERVNELIDKLVQLKNSHLRRIKLRQKRESSKDLDIDAPEIINSMKKIR